MPIEIRELVIKAVVSDPVKPIGNNMAEIGFAKLKKELVKQCVEEVMQKLKEKTER